jgi:LuxR family maltose regulon positive regulatory protein
LVPRPNLIQRLGEGLHLGHKLTLISAPAGFGKTTLLSEWVQAMGAATPPIAVAWLSLDEGDNDPTRFLTYFIAALNRVEGIEASIGEGALGMLQSPQPPPAEVVQSSLINDITAISDRIIIVLDDYHIIGSSQVDDALTFLLEHLPPPETGLHLVIATRDDPKLPLARLRARRQLTELRAADLRFSSSEAAEFLNQAMGLDLSAEDIAALETRTEGWIAGLQLAALALQGKALQGTFSMQGHKDTTSRIKSFSGSHRFVLDYLIEEVLEQQSESVQTFLLQTAVLNRLTGSLCDAVRFGIVETPYRSRGTAISKGTAVARREDGQAILEALEAANLFIVPLDEERHWYRYHHLFADLLRQRLRQKQPDWVPTLHIRASEWYEQNAFIDEAIEHALRGQDYERAAYLIEEQVDAIWERGEHAKLQRWLDGLPVELVFTKPQLCIFLAWDQLVNGQQEAAEQSLQAAEQALETNTDRATESLPIELGRLPDSESMKLQGKAAVIRAFLAFFRGDVQGIIQYAHLALDYLPEQDLTWRSTVSIALGDAYRIKGDLVAAHRAQLEALGACKMAGDIYPVMLSNVKVAINLRMQGKLQQTIKSCQQQMQFSKECGLSESGMAGWLLAVWGETLAELNDLDGAVHYAKKGIELIKGGGTLAMLTWSYMCLVRILFSREDLAGAEETIQKIENVARKSHVPPWITNQMTAWRARIWLAQDKLEAAVQWAGERELAADGKLTYLNEIEYMMLARILIAQQQLNESAGLLQRLLEAAEVGGRTSSMIEILIIQALTYQAQESTDQAITTLEKALTLAEPEGFIRIFVDEGPAMARLLYEAATGGIASDYARRLLAAFPMAEPEQTGPSRTQAPKSKLIEPLSERELEVLRLIAAGYSNRELARELVIALGTVKKHINNIFGKLDAHSRTQAVARARELDLI